MGTVKPGSSVLRGSAIGNAPNPIVGSWTLIVCAPNEAPHPMLGDKRKTHRRQLRYTAWISLGPKKLQGCVVSRHLGFRRAARRRKQQDGTHSFVLLLSRSGKPKRKCRVIWRKGAQIGVEFEKPLSRAEKHRPILKAETMSPPLSMLEPEPDDAGRQADRAGLAKTGAPPRFRHWNFPL